MLAACYECGKEISTDARRCPNCGYDYRDDEVSGDYASEYVKNESGGYRRMSVRESRSYYKNWLEEHWRKLQEERRLKLEKEALEKREEAQSLVNFMFLLLIAAGLIWLIIKIFPKPGP